MFQFRVTIRPNPGEVKKTLHKNKIILKRFETNDQFFSGSGDTLPIMFYQFY